jgi:hypothetical protein
MKKKKPFLPGEFAFAKHTLDYIGIAAEKVVRKKLKLTG